MLWVPIYVTKCCVFNEIPENHKICKIAIRRSEKSKYLFLGLLAEAEAQLLASYWEWHWLARKDYHHSVALASASIHSQYTERLAAIWQIL